jgi:hypothetical protein
MVAVKTKTKFCSRCGCELSLKELRSSYPRCCACERNECDKQEQRREREWRSPRIEDME